MSITAAFSTFTAVAALSTVVALTGATAANAASSRPALAHRTASAPSRLVLTTVGKTHHDCGFCGLGG